jgi:hypothetical protein
MVDWGEPGEASGPAGQPISIRPAGEVALKFSLLAVSLFPSALLFSSSLELPRSNRMLKGVSQCVLSFVRLGLHRRRRTNYRHPRLSITPYSVHMQDTKSLDATPTSRIFASCTPYSVRSASVHVR